MDMRRFFLVAELIGLTNIARGVVDVPASFDIALQDNMSAVSLTENQVSVRSFQTACFTNTNEIMEAVMEADISPVSTYTLCPNTVFDIGYLDEESSLVTNGSAPLLVRSNTHYVCGLGGDVSNNCILRGGDIQVLSSKRLFGESVSNARFHGIIFENALGVGVGLMNEGDITFQDCFIRVSNHSVLR